MDNADPETIKRRVLIAIDLSGNAKNALNCKY